MSEILIIITLVAVFFAAAYAVCEWLARRGGPRNGDDPSATG